MRSVVPARLRADIGVCKPIGNRRILPQAVRHAPAAGADHGKIRAQHARREVSVRQNRVFGIRGKGRLIGKINAVAEGHRIAVKFDREGRGGRRIQNGSVRL